jgi:hypothetical protein
MGCDVHDYVEIRRDGRWEYAGDLFPYPYHSDDRPSDVRRCWIDETFIDNGHRDRGEPCNNNCYTDNPSLCPHPYKCRNYDLFAILADVRNGRGFAGCKTGQGFNPIAPPRGIPADISPELLAEYTVSVDDDHTPEMLERWVRQGSSQRINETTVTDPDAHSASWFTVAELDAYDWNQTTTHYGWVDAAEYQEFKAKGKPSSWCGMVSGGAIKHVGPEEMEERIANGTAANRNLRQVG